MQRLPLDISTFSELRRLQYLYVDKTQYMYRMITQGRRYFLSRPRRFGKSLLVSALYEILTGKKHLFDDLWIASSDYDWQEHGVINLDFSQLKSESLGIFKQSLNNQLLIIAQLYGLTIDQNIEEPDFLLQQIVYDLFEKYGRVAILVDEYDSQILKTLHNKELAREIRDEIQHFFTVIKSLDAQIHFAFITGVSSFAKAGLFSGVNNLQIMTLRDDYAAICGYTDQEIDHYFTEYIIDWERKNNISYDDLRQQIKDWYNGYSFGYDVEKVYNPFSLMNSLNIQKFENFWIQSGTPTFLIEILKKEYKSFDPQDLTATSDFLGIFDIDTIPVISLMFQAGYLTISGYDSDSRQYTLDYPNDEVRIAAQHYLLAAFAHINPALVGSDVPKLFTAFNNHNIERVIELLQQLFAHVPYQLHITEERFYHGLLIMALVGARIKTFAEFSTSHARIDLVLELPKVLYIIEVKFNKPPQEALTQIEERRYYERFIVSNKPIILLGLSFHRKPEHFSISYVEKELQAKKEELK